MVRSDHRQGPKRIAVAIELDESSAHHYGCYRGILDFASERGDWQCVVDPHIVGMTGGSGAADYDGIVGRIGRHAVRQAQAHGIPIVNHWWNSPAVKELPGVFGDSREAGRIAGVHLIGRGFRRFGFMAMSRDRINPLQLAGFEQAIKERGFEPPIRFMTPRSFEKNPEDFSKFRRELYRWIADFTPPIGIYVTSAPMARYLAQVCRELNLRVPHDVGIVSGFNESTMCLGAAPTLSSVEPDYERVGYCAAELLDGLMRGERTISTDPIWIAPKGLRARASSDAFVCEDPMVSRAMRYIADHSNTSITVATVAREVNTTTRTLARRFDQFVGRSIYSEISRMRTEYLKRVLIDTDIPLGAMATHSGFCSTSHLTLFFRKATGMTPGAFRKQFGKAENPRRSRRGRTDPESKEMPDGPLETNV